MGKLVVLRLDGDSQQQGFRVSVTIGEEGDRSLLNFQAKKLHTA